MATEKRLIDANALVQDLENMRSAHKGKSTGTIYGGYTAAMCVVEGAKTVDAVEVVHGRWVFGTANHREYMKCSECLHSYTPDGTFCYCPNCGADMREKMDGDGNG